MVAVSTIGTLETLTDHLGPLDGHTVGVVLGCLEGLASKGRKMEIEGKVMGVVVRLSKGDVVHEFSGDSLAVVLAQIIRGVK